VIILQSEFALASLMLFENVPFVMYIHQKTNKEKFQLVLNNLVKTFVIAVNALYENSEQKDQ
jgi:hypothetical protein